MKGYLANSLFNESDRIYNSHIANRIRSEISNIELYVPQENMSINDKNSYASSTMIADGDDNYLWDSDFMVAVIDSNDLGVACEIGAFSTLGEIDSTEHGYQRPIFALYTDNRLQGTDNAKKIEALQNDPVESQFAYYNLYVIGKIKKSGGGIYHSIDSLLEAIENYIYSL